jgi:hypothetical protein
MQPTNDGWENIYANSPFNIVRWLDVPITTTSSYASYASHCLCNLYVTFCPSSQKLKSLPLEPQLDKGKEPVISLSLTHPRPPPYNQDYPLFKLKMIKEK